MLHSFTRRASSWAVQLAVTTPTGTPKPTEAPSLGDNPGNHRYCADAVSVIYWCATGRVPVGCRYMAFLHRYTGALCRGRNNTTRHAPSGLHNQWRRNARAPECSVHAGVKSGLPAPMWAWCNAALWAPSTFLIHFGSRPLTTHTTSGLTVLGALEPSLVGGREGSEHIRSTLCNNLCGKGPRYDRGLP